MSNETTEKPVDEMTHEELRQMFDGVIFDKKTAAEIICKALMFKERKPGEDRPRIADRKADALLLDIIRDNELLNGGGHE